MNQKERLQTFRNILKNYCAEQVLNRDDFKIIIELFKNHPTWKIKEGVGIKEIQVYIDKWKKKAFLLIRKNNTQTDISFIIASRGYSDSDTKRIKSACRYHITDEIFKFKDSIDFSNSICPITREKISRENCHIDHYNLSFEELVNKWLKNKNIIDIINTLNDNTKDNIIYDMFEDKNIVKDFIDFHNKHTHLRAVSKKANLSILRKKQ